ncbi:MAG: EI24 domain-containing protein [Pseudomonadota bacterium]
MSFVLESLRRAAGDLFMPRILAVVFLPMLAALLLWGALAWGFGASWLAHMQGLLGEVPWPDWMLGVAGVAAYALLALLLIPAIYVTALFITALVFMPLLVEVVSGKHHPALARMHGGSLIGSVANGAYALALYLLLWLLTLPFWLLGPFGAALPVLLNAWLNQRLFLYDALAEHASAEELRHLRREGGWPLYLLAALLGLLHFVPLLNLLAPVYMGLAFTHYGLARLAQYREGGTA